MFNFLNYFKDNRKKVIIVIACIAVIIYGVVMYLNYLKNDNNEPSDNSSSSNNTTAIIQNDTKNNVENNASLNITNDINSNTVNQNSIKVNNAIEAIQKFVNFCNSRDLDSAFNMLTDDCKEQLYNNSKDEFANKYVNSLFDKKRSNQINKWANSDGKLELYKVIFYENPINTGKIDASNSKNDYITAVYSDGTYKLNINGFIKREEINSSKKNNFMQVKVLNRLVFVDYEIYNVNIKNDILVDLTLDNMDDNIKTYLQDTDGNYFRILNTEYSSESTRVSNESEANFALKFDRGYSSTSKKISKLVFSRVNIINRMYREEVYNSDDDTISYEDKMSTYPETISIEINL